MQHDADNQEALREALLSLDRLREQEKAARLQMEMLVDGLQILNECKTVADMYREILVCLNRLIDFDSAGILVEETEGLLSTAVASDHRLTFRNVPIAGFLERCLDGRATTLTNIAQVQNWPDNAVPATSFDADSDKQARNLQSALLVSLPSLKRRMMLVCASEKLSGFKKKELELLKSFAPLATQAVRRASEMEQLNYLANTLDHQAHFDLLTGLPNRIYFENTLNKLDTARVPYSIMFIDLDNFKAVNDSFGHTAGDILLSEVAFRMSSVVDPDDTLARMGGDEFALVVRSQTTLDFIHGLCSRLLDAINQPLYFKQSRILPTASIGVLNHTRSDSSSQQKMQKADIAMYGAKDLGRNQYCFFSNTMKSQIQTRFDIESLLPLAIRQQQFHLVYQPIFNSQTMQCDRAEVLLRWGTEGGSRFSPGLFIPVAEKTGHIVELGDWILHQALTEFRGWLQDSDDNTLSINVSQTQLQRTDFSDRFLECVDSFGVDFRQIELELSENIVADCVDSNLSYNLKCLDRSGIRFAFDDFGTGSSSLLHLLRFPGTCLKIDKSFVDDIVTSDVQSHLVSGMIDFAHHLGLHVVAEGVETEEQLQALTRLGADYIQGFLLAKPARAEHTLALLSDWEHTVQPGCKQLTG